jgi:shikimate kinase
MHFGFIGMAGVGKSYWAQKFSEVGYTCFHCDDIIAAHLQAELGESLATVHDLGDWMGFPDETGYLQKEEKYLELERQTLQEIAEVLANGNSENSQYVIDMTGSAIYTGSEVLQKLRQHLTIVYFGVSTDVHQQMLQEYMARPRPLVWRGIFQSQLREPLATSLARCYPQLIENRERMYEELCDIKLDYQIHRRPGLTVDEFLTYVQGQIQDRKIRR